MVVRARSGQRFSKSVTLSFDDVARFARAAGDDNPIHHDHRFAAATRFGKPIASGPQTSALLMAFTASHFSGSGPILGLDFGFRFKAPVYADQTVRMEWLIISVKRSERLQGDLVDLRGRMLDAAGATVVGAKGRILLREEY
ncbi:MAG: 3-hydroxybutyryl-CoA dehydratase [Chlamydiales bacterium]|jgi:3-hydroxybutyryl-CoA dehydratase